MIATAVNPYRLILISGPPNHAQNAANIRDWAEREPGKLTHAHLADWKVCGFLRYQDVQALARLVGAR